MQGVTGEQVIRQKSPDPVSNYDIGHKARDEDNYSMFSVLQASRDSVQHCKND